MWVTASLDRCGAVVSFPCYVSPSVLCALPSLPPHRRLTFVTHRCPPSHSVSSACQLALLRRRRHTLRCLRSAVATTRQADERRLLLCFCFCCWFPFFLSCRSICSCVFALSIPRGITSCVQWKGRSLFEQWVVCLVVAAPRCWSIISCHCLPLCIVSLSLSRAMGYWFLLSGCPSLSLYVLVSHSVGSSLIPSTSTISPLHSLTSTCSFSNALRLV